MSEFIKRIEIEITELNDKLNKLRIFLESPAFKALAPEMKSLLWDQDQTMDHYLWLLNQRMKLLRNQK